MIFGYVIVLGKTENLLVFSVGTAFMYCLASSSGSSGGAGGGTPSSQEQRRRRGSSVENRAAAFQLTPKNIRDLTKSEQAHDQAMTAFLGEQVCTRY